MHKEQDPDARPAQDTDIASIDERLHSFSSSFSSISSNSVTTVTPLSQENITLPLSIFSTENISSFHAIVTYLKDIAGMRLSEIAAVTNRDHRTVWGS